MEEKESKNVTKSHYKNRNRLSFVSSVHPIQVSISIFIVAFCYVFAFYPCLPITSYLFICIILNLVTVLFHFHLTFCSPWWRCFVSPKHWTIKTLFSCPIGLAIGFFVLFNIADPDLHQDPAPTRCCLSKWSLHYLRREGLWEGVWEENSAVVLFVKKKATKKWNGNGKSQEMTHKHTQRQKHACN